MDQNASRYLVIDTETTGLSISRKAIEIAAIKVDNGEVVDRFSSLIRIGEPLDPIITAITGITDAMLDDAPPATEVLPAFANFAEGLPVVGHNVAFDIHTLERDFERIGLSFTLQRLDDTMYMSRKRFPEWSSHRLFDLVMHFGAMQDTEHRAMADAKATMICYQKMLGIPEVVSKHPINRQKSEKEWDIGESVDLQGRAICITGALNNWTREEAIEEIKKHNGVVKPRLSKKLNILVIGDGLKTATDEPVTSKHKEAIELIKQGATIEIIPEAEFMQLMGYTKK